MLLDDPTKPTTNTTTDAALPKTAAPTATPTAGAGLAAGLTAANPTTSATAATKAAGGTGLAAGLGSTPAAAPQLADSVADKVKALTSQDSPLMQQAKTDGLKIANRRGLLNSSMAAGASQDAMIRQATPIAMQDASQSFQKNMQASQQGFQSSEAQKDRDQQTSIVDKQITSTEGLAAQQRALEERMQNTAISAQDRQQIRDIESREGIAAAERALQELMQGKQITSTEGLAQKQRELEEKLQGKDLASREAIAAAQRELETKLQETAISAQEKQQIRDIQSREGQAAAERALQAAMQSADINARADLADNERKNQQLMQDREIAYQNANRNLDRNLQEQLASWNLKSSDRNAAAQFLTNMESSYQDSYNSIMANTALDAATRTAQLASAKALRDKNLSFVEQMYGVDLKWTDADFAGGTNGRPAATPAPAPVAGFNEAAYLAANPDVAKAVRAGQYKSGLDHFNQSGTFEGRSPSGGPAQKAFNAAAYLAKNPDVAASVRSGQMTAEQHYQQFGRSEGRTW